jgi:hypothetical protein
VTEVLFKWLCLVELLELLNMLGCWLIEPELVAVAIKLWLLV